MPNAFPVTDLDLFFALIGGITTATMLYFPTLSTRKVGGLRFVRVGRYQLSFCRLRNPNHNSRG